MYASPEHEIEDLKKSAHVIENNFDFIRHVMHTASEHVSHLARVCYLLYQLQFVHVTGYEIFVNRDGVTPRFDVMFGKGVGLDEITTWMDNVLVSRDCGTFQLDLVKNEENAYGHNLVPQ